MFLRSLVLFLILPLMTLAQDLPQPLSDTISDFADLLPPETEARVAAMIRKTSDETGVHIVVVTLDRIANYGGAGLGVETYAIARRGRSPGQDPGSSGFGGGRSSGGGATGRW